MSVPFFKIFAGVLLVHILVLNIVWVGFSAPLPRPPATFTYEGALPIGGPAAGAEDVWPKGKISDQFSLDHPDASYANHWIDLRGPSR